MRFQRIETHAKFILSCFIVLFSSTLLYSETFTKNNNESSSLEKEGLKYCSTCHAPNIDDSNFTEPLWLDEEIEHEFKTYSSDNNTNQHGFPSGKAKLCLGCHDGTVAVEDKNIYASSSSLNSNSMGFPSHNAHPVSIIYNSSLAILSGDLADPSFEPSGLGGTIEEDLLENGKIVCTSCHAMHQRMNSENSFSNHFKNRGMSLKISNEGSKLCLTCHRK